MDLPKIAECPVCLELFTEPKVLSCGHCFCKKCINAAPRGFTGQLKVNCPECRQESSVPAAGFPTNYRLLDIVSNLESAGFRNSKDCAGCGRKTPKAELFSCTSCQEEIGNAQELIICSLCYVKAHKTHAVVEFNKATPLDVQQARDKIEWERDTTQQHVARVRSHLEEMTQEVMQALDARVPRHDELRDQLGAENVSKDDIEAKLAQSETHLAETVSIVDKMRDAIDRCGRNLMAHVQQEDTTSQAATARPAADRPTTSAAALAEMRSDVLHAWDFGFGLYDGIYDGLRALPTPPRLLSPDVVDFWPTERPTLAAADAANSEERPPRGGSPTIYRRPPGPTVTVTGGSLVPPPQRNISPSVVRPIQVSWAPAAITTRRHAEVPERSVAPLARATAPARSPPPRHQATPARLRDDIEPRPWGAQDLDADAFRNMARTMDRINDTWRNYERSASLFPAAADGAASSSGTAASRNVPQEPARGRSPPRDPRRQARRMYAVISSSDEEDDNNGETTARASLAAAAKRARRNGGN